MSTLRIAAALLLATTLTARADVTRIAPAEAGFFSKRLDYGGIPIKAHEVVDDRALELAYLTLGRMLGHRPQLYRQLVARGVELHIIGKDQVTSDLPENRYLKGKPFDGAMDVDQRTRGLGGQLSSCGEENLLHLAADRYAGMDICVHEFAHAIASLGVSSEVRAAIEDQYRRSLDRGLWRSTYASTNADELFAELSMWWFGTHGDGGQLSERPEPGREWLERYDPEAASLLDDLYGGRLVTLSPARIRATTVTGPRTEISFTNASARPVRVWWLDGRGQRRFYAALSAGQSYRQPTYTGHAWLITDDAGAPVAAYVAEASSAEARIR